MYEAAPRCRVTPRYLLRASPDDARAPINIPLRKADFLFLITSLGMSHDVQQENGCPGIVYHGNGYVVTTVMHPGDMYITKKWSECSRRYLRSYIE